MDNSGSACRLLLAGSGQDQEAVDVAGRDELDWVFELDGVFEPDWPFEPDPDLDEPDPDSDPDLPLASDPDLSLDSEPDVPFELDSGGGLDRLSFR
ncbi:MAG: hypothetical protein ACRDSH_09940 [Pseudonocardiaceae bacterium]